MEIELSYDKSLNENISNLFDKSKKAKKKMEAIQKAMQRLEKESGEFKKQALLKKELDAEKIIEKELVKKRKRDWFEKFHWFFTSDNFLVLCGKDAKSNEQLVKKHLSEEDLYFHADLHGAAHCVLKTSKAVVPAESQFEAAQFAAIHSKAFQHGTGNIDVYSVSASQVSKQAKSGEFLSTGAFMIYGKRNYFKKVSPEFGIGIMKKNNELKAMSAPLSAIKKNCFLHVEIIMGKKKKSELAKELLLFFSKKLLEKNLNPRELLSLDEIISLLPCDGLEIRK